MTTAADLVSAAKATTENLGPADVAGEMDAGDAVLIDLREAEELASGRIPGSIHVPRGMLEFRADPSSTYHDDRIDPSKRVILHCASGGRSALGAQTLAELGYGNVAHLDGGITRWREEGHPVTEG